MFYLSVEAAISGVIVALVSEIAWRGPVSARSWRRCLRCPSWA